MAAGAPMSNPDAQTPDGAMDNGPVSAPDAKLEPKNPPVDEATRAQFAQHGIFQGADGAFYKDGQVMQNDQGQPMTADEIKADIAGGKITPADMKPPPPAAPAA